MYQAHRQVVVLDDLVRRWLAITWWAAKQGLAAARYNVESRRECCGEFEHLWEELRAASERKGAVAKVVGDTDKGLSQGVRIDAAYELPF